MLKTWLSGKLFVKKNSYRKEKEKEKKRIRISNLLSCRGREKKKDLR